MSFVQSHPANKLQTQDQGRRSKFLQHTICQFRGKFSVSSRGASLSFGTI